jgi:hypothetical protein
MKTALYLCSLSKKQKAKNDKIPLPRHRTRGFTTYTTDGASGAK